MDSSNQVGGEFEHQVHEVLQGIAKKYPNRVHVERQPQLILQNGDTVRPDFDLLIIQPHERQFYFVECQARAQYSKEISQKINYIRSKSWRQTFLFVYPASIPKNVKRSLEIDNILHFALPEFKAYLGNIEIVLEGLRHQKVDSGVDPAMVLEVYASLKSALPLSLALDEVSTSELERLWDILHDQSYVEEFIARYMHPSILKEKSGEARRQLAVVLSRAKELTSVKNRLELIRPSYGQKDRGMLGRG